MRGPAPVPNEVISAPSRLANYWRNVAKTLQERMPRTVDIYPTILELQGMEPPNRIGWEIPRLWGLMGFDHREAEVRTDIDGQALDIWER